MGCNFSTEPVRVLEPQAIGNGKNPELEASVSDKRSSFTKSHESFLSSIDSIESDKLTIHSGSDILSPHRSKSVDFNRNGSANRDEPPPVATATIIRNTSLSNTPSSTRRNTVSTGLPHQVDDVVSSPDVMLTSDSQSELEARKKALLRGRRSSDGDVGNVTSVTCIPRSLIKANALLNSKADMKIKPPMFGPRNSRLTVTQSQKDFFRMLDEKVAQGKDYSSEDERSLASFHSLSNRRNDSFESNGFSKLAIAQQVR